MIVGSIGVYHRPESRRKHKKWFSIKQNNVSMPPSVHIVFYSPSSNKVNNEKIKQTKKQTISSKACVWSQTQRRYVIPFLSDLYAFTFNDCYSQLFSCLVLYLDFRKPEGRLSFMHLLCIIKLGVCRLYVGPWSMLYTFTMYNKVLLHLKTTTPLKKYIPVLMGYAGWRCCRTCPVLSLLYRCDRTDTEWVTTHTSHSPYV